MIEPARLLRRPLVTAIAVAIVVAAASTAAASGWLPIFEPEQIETVSLSASDLVELPDLDAYGDLIVTRPPDVHTVADAAAAAEETGLDVPTVTGLPPGVSGRPVYQVGSAVTATFTFSAQRAAAAAGEVTAPAPPPGLDGSTIRLVAGPALAATWSRSAGTPQLLVGRAVAPKVYSSGAEFETMRDYLLSLPGVPSELSTELHALGTDGSTLPLPLPAGAVTSWPADIGGRPATVLATRDRTLAAVVWIDDGVITVVAGSLDTDEVLTIARDLR